jgi:diguanylate cyclase (GGDEF)-like protein/PAS domain S-box-containing protein
MEPDPNPKKPLILVADDDRLIRALARDALESAGYAIAEAQNGREALEAFENLHPDLVMLDVTMPVLDGFLTCAEIRRRHPGDPTPILVVTSSGDLESIDRAYESGATDFVSKPVNWTLMGHRMRHFLRSSEAFRELSQGRLLLADAQRIAHLGSWEWDTETNQMKWSDEVFRIFGCEPDSCETSYERFWSFAKNEDALSARKKIEESLRSSKQFSIGHRIQLPDGSERYVEQQGEIALSPGHPEIRVLGTIQDVTDQRRSQEQIRRLANFDSLTGLANRRHFKKQLTKTLERAREKNLVTALLYMDLDRFKRINDTLGHTAGDELLKSVAETLRNHVRGGDLVARVEGEDDKPSVSRLGGDEFSILLSSISNAEDAADVARRILDNMPTPIVVDGHQLSTTASIGIAIYPDDGQDVETLVRHADTAMYHAKSRGLNQFQFFDESMNSAILRKLTLESRLAESMERDELRLHYQPKVGLPGRELVGAEALLRWEHPDLGTISPKEIIPMSEESGFIVSLGEWVLRQACKQIRAWREDGFDVPRIAVNVSTRQLAQKNLQDVVADALRENRLEPNDIEIEITETAILKDDEDTARMLRDLRAMGIRIALDDFGTGYSSMSYVCKFPLDVIKLDRCFVCDVANDPAAAGVANAVIMMAHSLGLTVVAEGVDAESQARILTEQGCDEMQGFLINGALCPEEFSRLLTNRRSGT